jgi:hypothetical protein
MALLSKLITVSTGKFADLPRTQTIRDGMRKEDVPLSWREGSLAQDSAGPVASADKDSQEAQRLTELDYLQAVRPEADHAL